MGAKEVDQWVQTFRQAAQPRTELPTLLLDAAPRGFFRHPDYPNAKQEFETADRNVEFGYLAIMHDKGIVNSAIGRGFYSDGGLVFERRKVCFSLEFKEGPLDEDWRRWDHPTVFVDYKIFSGMVMAYEIPFVSERGSKKDITLGEARELATEPNGDRAYLKTVYGKGSDADETQAIIEIALAKHFAGIPSSR